MGIKDRLGSAWRWVVEFVAARRRLEWTKALYKRWADVPQIALVAFGLLVGYYLFRRMDPDAGYDRLDLFGKAMALGLAIGTGLLITFSAWWCKKTYTRDLNDKDEEFLMQGAVTNWKAFAVLVLDRVEWVLWLVFWFWLLRSV